MVSPRSTVFVFIALACVVLGACGHSSPKAVAPTTTTLPPVVAVGPNPSVSAKMVCSPEAETDIAANLGVKTIARPTATWKDHIYTCRYVYANGVMILSVKELTRASETTAYFNHLATTLHKAQPFSIAQGGFITSGGSAVVRKDYKVLTVNVSGLPIPFGKPPFPHLTIATTVATAILGCWTGE